LWETVDFAAFPHAAPWALFEDGMESADSGGLVENDFSRPLRAAAGSLSFPRCGGMLDPPNCC
jgi:hypothetical protein